MINFIINIVIGIGWAAFFITIVPYIVIVIITAFSKEKNPETVKFLKLYLLLPATLITITLIRVLITANFYRPGPSNLEEFETIENKVDEKLDSGDWVSF